jgi:hypothetical protein
MTSKILTFILFVLSSESFAQKNQDLLFDSDTPLDISIRMSIADVKGTKSDSSYVYDTLYYRNSSGIFESVAIKLKGRGNFRFRECYYPPAWIKINRKEAKGTLFEKNRNLKLVLPCRSASGNSQIIREYLCYKLFESISGFCFRTRLLNIDFTEVNGKRKRKAALNGILIEDIDDAAKRLDATPQKNRRIHPKLQNDTSAARLYLFEYLISNTDWSVVYQHNMKLIMKPPNIFIYLPYDFDMSGFVDAPYSTVSQIGDQQLPIRHVRQRLYRGYCIAPGAMEYVRQEFLSKKEMLLLIPPKYGSQLSPNNLKNINGYLNEFFKIVADKDLFKKRITNWCREE